KRQARPTRTDRQATLTGGKPATTETRVGVSVDGLTQNDAARAFGRDGRGRRCFGNGPVQRTASRTGVGDREVLTAAGIDRHTEVEIGRAQADFRIAATAATSRDGDRITGGVVDIAGD